MADKKETQADFHLIELAMPDQRLLEIQDRASEIIRFTARMQDAHLSTEERDREMSMVRAHCKGLSEAARDYLRDNQPDWYKLDENGRSEAIRKAFKEARG